MERHHAEQLSIREELRRELSQVHMEKFSAMAAELSHVHKVRSKDGLVVFSHQLNYYSIIRQKYKSTVSTDNLLNIVIFFLSHNCVLAD